MKPDGPHQCMTACECRHACLPLCDLCRSLQELVPRTRRLLQRFASRYGCFLPEADCEDLTERVLSELACSGQPCDRLRSLAVRIARRRLIDWVRRSVRCRCEFRGDRLDEQASRPSYSDLAIDLTAAMDMMAPDTRKVFVACGIEQQTLAQAVALLGLSLHTVRTLYAEAIRIVAEVLGIDDSEENLSVRAENAGTGDIAS